MRSCTYTACGMASVTAVLLALSDGDGEIVAPDDAYFETFRAIELVVRGRVARTSDPTETADRLRDGVLLVDSCGAQEHLAHLAAAGLSRCVVFDTTCYLRDDPRISGAVAACARARVPLALVRSHLKLDGLGLELGRLGSTTWILPDTCSSAQADRVSTWVARHDLALGSFGGRPNPVSLLLEGGGEPLRALTAERTAAIRANGRAWVAVLQDRLPGRVRRFHHDLFLTLDPADADVDPLRLELVAALVDAGVPAAALGSFGHDRVGVDTFTDPRGRRHLRVGPGDLPEALVLQAANVVADRLGGGLR